MIMRKVLLRKGFLFDIVIVLKRILTMAAHELNDNNRIIKKLTYTGAALLLTGSLISCSKEEAPATCESPRATSSLFPAEPNATENRATWKNGVAIRTEVPAEANGIVVGYRGQNADTWNDSKPVSPDRAQTVAVLLGNGAVSFSVHTIAAEGSAACANKPGVTFSEPQPTQPLIATDITLPTW
jgi:hypothetical protein